MIELITPKLVKCGFHICEILPYLNIFFIGVYSYKETAKNHIDIVKFI